MSEYTGNYVPLDKSLTIQYVMKLLDEYDQQTKNGIHPVVNPYKDNIIIDNQNGNRIVIPKEIQRMAIIRWLFENSIDEENYDETDRSTDSEIEKQKNDDINGSDDTSMLSVFVKIIFCMMIIILILYVLSKSRKGFVWLGV